MFKKYDVIVIGGGHAGCEAAAAAARIGVSVAIVTFSESNIGELSCNPSIGGVGKGIIVKELDALDGVMPVVTDRSSTHSKVLNSSRGPAVWGPRAQVDRDAYKSEMRHLLKSYPNLDIIYAEVTDLLINDGCIYGISSNIGDIMAKSIVITTGTFLNGVIHIGDKQIVAGRVNENSSNMLGEAIKRIGLIVRRLKTGTPPRIKTSSIKWDQLEKQPGDESPHFFSVFTENLKQSQLDCRITYTNSKTHKIISDNLHLSAIYSGNISGAGPRYCPSIEDKIMRFSSKERHQIFLEREGVHSELTYPNGISTSLPEEVQSEIIHSINGLQDAEIVRFGYAIEYDYIDPKQLKKNLELKQISGLFMAGQINGTTGYEEAAGQGLVAGANAALRILGKEFILNRTDSYIGVMIDDLTTVGVSEPYRMMTSRAEYRLQLRPDNADIRLTQIGMDVGLIGAERAKIFSSLKCQLDVLRENIKSIFISDKRSVQYNVINSNLGQKRSLYEVIGMNKVNLDAVYSFLSDSIEGRGVSFSKKLIEKLSIESMYDNYAKKQEKEIQMMKNDYLCIIPENFDYSKISGLSNEAVEKLSKLKPKNAAEIKRIPGIPPTVVLMIQLYLRKKHTY